MKPIVIKHKSVFLFLLFIMIFLLQGCKENNIHNKTTKATDPTNFTQPIGSEGYTTTPTTETTIPTSSTQPIGSEGYTSAPTTVSETPKEIVTNKPVPIPNGEVNGTLYTNEEFQFSLELPAYWNGKTYIVENKENMVTGALQEIIFYNKYLFDKEEVSSSFIFQLEVYDLNNFPKDLKNQQAGIQVLGENDTHIVIAVLRTGIGIIEDKEGAMQWAKMDKSVQSVVSTFKFN